MSERKRSLPLRTQSSTCSYPTKVLLISARLAAIPTLLIPPCVLLFARTSMLSWWGKCATMRPLVRPFPRPKPATWYLLLCTPIMHHRLLSVLLIAFRPPNNRRLFHNWPTLFLALSHSG